MALFTAAAVAVIGGSTALAGLYASKRNEQQTRRATIECQCGKVKADVVQPAANYKYAEVSNFQCACNDCVGYCKAVSKILVLLSLPLPLPLLWCR